MLNTSWDLGRIKPSIVQPPGISSQCLGNQDDNSCHGQPLDCEFGHPLNSFKNVPSPLWFYHLECSSLNVYWWNLESIYSESSLKSSPAYLNISLSDQKSQPHVERSQTFLFFLHTLWSQLFPWILKASSCLFLSNLYLLFRPILWAPLFTLSCKFAVCICLTDISHLICPRLSPNLLFGHSVFAITVYDTTSHWDFSRSGIFLALSR